LTIDCQGTIFQVHKFLLVTKGGDFFQGAICSGFSESQSSVIKLPEEDPLIIARVLDHLYTSSYTSSLSENVSNANASAKDAEDSNVDAILVHVKMFAIAAKFGIASLRNEARQAFVKTFDSNIPDLCLDKLKESFVSIASAVYATTPANERDLRDFCLLQVLLEQYTCPDGEDGAEHGALIDLMLSLPELAVDASVYWLDQLAGEEWPYDCQSCDESVNWIVGPCACRRWKGACNEAACNEARKVASICGSCGAKGSLVRKKPFEAKQMDSKWKP
jgi:hypothetical protein